MGAEPGRRFLKQPAAMLEPVIVVSEFDQGFDVKLGVNGLCSVWQAICLLRKVRKGSQVERLDTKHTSLFHAGYTPIPGS